MHKPWPDSSLCPRASSGPRSTVAVAPAQPSNHPVLLARQAAPWRLPWLGLVASQLLQAATNSLVRVRPMGCGCACLRAAVVPKLPAKPTDQLNSLAMQTLASQDAASHDQYLKLLRFDDQIAELASRRGGWVVPVPAVRSC